MQMEIRRATSADSDAVKGLAKQHPFADNRCYRFFKFDFASDYLTRQVESFMTGNDPVAYIAMAGGEVIGFGGGFRSEWDSSHFGLEMGSVPFLFSARKKGPRAEIAGALLDAVVKEMRERGIQHLSVKTDLEDMAGLYAAQQCQFQVMDTLVTYINDASKNRPSMLKIDPELDLTTYDKNQMSQIAYEEVAEIVEFMRKAYRIDRYHADRRLPQDRADEVYVEWFNKALSGKWADGVHVIRKGGKMIGFCFVQYQAEIAELYGAKITGRGLAGVIPEGRGAYAVLTEMGCTRCPIGTQFQEFDTQIQNLPVINVWIRQGLPFMRGRQMLHRWLDE